uniref:Uncharacterized protein n=1 Tax=Xiphophorus couchianus TaxID=32473 RepID=A0A3B5LH01_9TELE
VSLQDLFCSAVRPRELCLDVSSNRGFSRVRSEVSQRGRSLCCREILSPAALTVIALCQLCLMLFRNVNMGKACAVIRGMTVNPVRDVFFI